MSTIDLEVERSRDSLKGYVHEKLMSREEEAEILRKRIIYLTTLKSPNSSPLDFKLAIDYETDLKNYYFSLASEALKSVNKSEKAWNRHIKNLYFLLCKKFGKKEISFYLEFLKFILNTEFFSDFAEILCEEILEKHQKNPDSWILVASLMINLLNDFDGARKIFQKAIRVNFSLKIFEEWIRMEFLFIKFLKNGEKIENLEKNEIFEVISGKIIEKILFLGFSQKNDEIEKIEFLRNLQKISEISDFSENCEEAKNNLNEKILILAEKMENPRKILILEKNIEKMIEKTPKNQRKNLDFLIDYFLPENLEFLSNFSEDFGDEFCAEIFLKIGIFEKIPENFSLSRFFLSLFLQKNYFSAGKFSDLNSLIFEKNLKFSKFSKISAPNPKILKILNEKIGVKNWENFLKLLFSANLAKNCSENLSEEAKKDPIFIFAEISEIYSKNPEKAAKICEKIVNFCEDEKLAILIFSIFFNEKINYQKIVKKAQNLKWNNFLEFVQKNSLSEKIFIEKILNFEEISDLIKY